jgi:putative glutamine amidotransferase
MRITVGVTRCRTMDDYLRAVEASGGVPLVLDSATNSPAEALADVSALLLTGGTDVDPARYGASRHPATQDPDAIRDGFEIDLLRRALDRNVPVLAICRGIQVLNVAFGGTLVQDIPTEIPTSIAHTIRNPANALAHSVRVSPGTRLSELLNDRLGAGTTCAVNSRHHQAPATIGEGLVIAAVAPDGVVEALEWPTARFCLGVQWHPENFWRSGEFAGLFRALMAAAR